ncbi:MAG: lysophospholipid acyltransferase family protein [candidate division KSB1 bacterium]|nr:lysophospholipid acyltransferase family protein [candidate division KSB1 bacterium]MDZ7272647.1 lysophospholipid acyltransferase family protein [candidate division KSB1 bacterium]MDZ7284331.1 lysophospholipid acyltransferase family protein [candidate division KSB1 bacterium]MDZ7297273.1 lysophospholipid acyltransferase family protein [candidate division KSB1 bacterium]MDZ7309046.1 lysophospholipid acyltransferase family protein [candidate division KSB1 bacterium]
MIPAKHARWADLIFHPYLRLLCRRHFHRLEILGTLPHIDPQLPVLLLPNHSTWWDGFFVYLLNRTLFHRRPYLMMLQEQLARYAFFARLGAFSIDPHSPREVRQALRYAAHCLQAQPPVLLALFPQGELRPWHVRPLGYRRGLEVLLKMAQCRVNLLNLAIQASFHRERRAEVFFLFDENRRIDHRDFPDHRSLERAEERLLAELRERCDRGESGLPVLV